MDKCRECNHVKSWHHTKFKAPCSRETIKNRSCYGIACTCGERFV
jgi:hypothetical protein